MRAPSQLSFCLKSCHSTITNHHPPVDGGAPSFNYINSPYLLLDSSPTHSRMPTHTHSQGHCEMLISSTGYDSIANNSSLDKLNAEAPLGWMSFAMNDPPSLVYFERNPCRCGTRIRLSPDLHTRTKPKSLLLHSMAIITIIVMDIIIILSIKSTLKNSKHPDGTKSAHIKSLV